MRGALGLSDDLWALLVEIAGLVIAFLIGLLVPGRVPSGPAMLLGVVVNVIAGIFIAGGEAAFFGFVAFRVIYWIAAGAGNAVQTLRQSIRGRPKPLPAK